MRKRKEKHSIKNEKITGVLEKTRAGFGFVRREEGGDIFIARSNMYGAMHGDRVQVDMLPEYLRTRSREGIIDKILERGTTGGCGHLPEK